MGALGYPEFQLVTPGLGRSVDMGGRAMTASILFGLAFLALFAGLQTIRTPLDPNNVSLTLKNLAKAATALGQAGTRRVCGCFRSA